RTAPLNRISTYSRPRPPSWKSKFDFGGRGTPFARSKFEFGQRSQARGQTLRDARSRSDPVPFENLVGHFAELLRFAFDVRVVPVVLRRKCVARESVVAARDFELVADFFADGDRAHEVVDGFDFV